MGRRSRKKKDSRTSGGGAERKTIAAHPAQTCRQFKDSLVMVEAELGKCLELLFKVFGDRDWLGVVSEA